MRRTAFQLRVLNFLLIPLVATVHGCAEAEPAPQRREAQFVARARATATARAEATRRAPLRVERRAVVHPVRTNPAPRVARVQRRDSEGLDGALLGMEPDAVMRKLSEIQGPLEGAHYVLQRGSEVEVPGELPRPVEGELSLVDCSLVHPGDPRRGRLLWIGGLRIDGAPDLFDGRIERSLTLPILDGPGLVFSGRWADARVIQGSLSGLRRTLDAGVEESWAGTASVWKRELVLDADRRSPVAFHDDRDLCPWEITLHLTVRDRIETWERGPKGMRLASVDSDVTLARATLVALWVSPDPEIIDPVQRIPRVKSLLPSATDMPTATVRQHLSPRRRATGELQTLERRVQGELDARPLREPNRP